MAYSSAHPLPLVKREDVLTELCEIYKKTVFQEPELKTKLTLARLFVILEQFKHIDPLLAASLKISTSIPRKQLASVRTENILPSNISRIVSSQVVLRQGHSTCCVTGM